MTCTCWTSSPWHGANPKSGGLSRPSSRPRSNLRASENNVPLRFVGLTGRILQLTSSTPRHPHQYRRGDATLLKRTAHSADLHPTDPSSILLFGGYGPTSGATEPTFLNDLVLLRTGSRTVERLVTIVGPLPGVVGAAGAGAGLVGVAPPLPRAYHSCTSLGGRCGEGTPRVCVQMGCAVQRCLTACVLGLGS